MATSNSAASMDVFLKEHLLYVHTKAEAGDYADAMAALQETKAAIRDNVYVTAVEHQLVSLLDLSRRHALTDDRKAEFLEPISGIIERVIGSPARRQDQAKAPAGAGQVPPEASLSAFDKQAALDGLKVRYFEQASRHLTAGEYKLALGEIQRVFVIEPENITAKQYESIILELMNLKGQLPSPMQPTISPRTITREALRAFEQAPVLRHPERTAEFPPNPKEEVPILPPPAGAEEPVEDLDSGQSDSEPLLSISERDSHWPAIERSIAAHHVFSHERVVAEEPRSDAARKVLVIAVALVVLLLGIGTVSLLLYEGTTNPEPSSEGTLSSSQTDASKSEPGAVQHTVVPESEQGQPSDKAPTSLAPSTQPKHTASPSPTEKEPSHETPLTRAPQLKHEALAQITPVSSDEIPASSGGNTGPSQTPASPALQTPIVSVPEGDTEPFVAVEKDPQIVKLERPLVPDAAWQGASDLQIIVRVMIDENGKPTKTKVLKGENPLLQAAVINAIMKSTFTPGIMGKAPVVSWLTVPFKFKRNS